MARIVNNSIKQVITLVAKVVHTNGTFDTMKFTQDQMVTNLRYTEDGKIKSITGRVSEIKYIKSNKKRVYNNILSAKSYFKYDVTPAFLQIDTSTEYHSNLVDIPIMEIIENSGVTDVDHIETYLEYGISGDVLLSDESVNKITLMEGDVFENLVYITQYGEKTVTGKVIAITYTSSLINEKYGNLKPQALVCNVDNYLKQIPIYAIKDIDSSSSPVSESLQTALDNNSSGVVYVAANELTGPIKFSKNVTLYGNKAGISATLSKRSKTDFSDETVLSGAVSFSSGCSVTLDGVVLTKDALISLGDAKEVTLKNSIITGLSSNVAKGFVVKGTQAKPCKLTIENCYFGENPTVDGKSFKNTFELDCRLKDGSVFRNNYFAHGCSYNNDICIDEGEDDSKILMEKNTWEYSASGIRVGARYAAKCEVNINGNKYMATDKINPEYAGLVLVQPYEKQTTSMKDIKINISNTSHYDPYQVYYMYSGSGDMPFTKDTIPTITLNGKVQDLSSYCSE